VSNQLGSVPQGTSRFRTPLAGAAISALVSSQGTLESPSRFRAPRWIREIRARGRMVVVVVASLFSLAGLMSWGAPAEALVTHKFEGQIAGVPAEGPHGPVASPGPLEQVHALAAESGELFVQDDRVDVFDGGSLGFLGQPSLPGVVFGDGAGEPQLYANTEHAVDVYGAGVCGDVRECPVLQKEWAGADTPQGSFGLITGLAVDRSTAGGDWASGDVVLAAPQSDVVDVFKPQANGGEAFIETAQLKGTPLEGEPATGQGEPFQFPNRIAISGLNGDVIVADARAEGPVIDIFQPVGAGEYAFVTHIAPPSAASIESLAVDGANGDIYAGLEPSEGSARIVEELDAAGEPLATIDGAETPSGNLRHVTSLAVDPVSHRVFVADFREGEQVEQGFVDVYSGDEIAPDVVTGPAEGTQPELATHTWAATLTGTVDPDSAGEATCQFVWGTTTSFGSTTKCTQPVSDGSEPVAVQAPLTGLQPGTTYFYKLQAQNEHANNLGEGFAEFKTPGPTLAGESVAEVSSTGVTLKATINPNGQPTSYRFEYDTAPYTPGQAAHGAAVPGVLASIGAGSADVEVEQHIQHLTPASTYHYRVVAVTEYEPGKSEEFDEADHTLTTQDIGGAKLPDNRAWELVSPPDKHGAAIFGLIKGFQAFQSATEAAADGGAMTYTALSPTEAEPAGYTGASQVMSTRGPGGWRSVDLSPPHNSATALESGPEYPFFSEDLSTGLAQLSGIDETLLSSAASESTPYVRSTGCVPPSSGTGDCYTPLVTAKEGQDEDVPLGTVFGGAVEFVGASADMSHIMLRSTAQLTNTVTENHKELYEWTAGQPGSRRLELVSLLPAEEGGGPVTESVDIGRNPAENLSSGTRAIAAEGSRVFWSLGASGGPRLYMRDTTKGETVRIDRAQPGAAGGPPDAFFEAANTDGSRVFFTDTEQLTPQSSQHGADLYECDIAEAPAGLTCVLKDLTPEAGSIPSEVQTLIVGASDDGSYVYFVANGVMPGSPPGVTEGACGFQDDPADTCNLYLYHDGATRFIATLSAEDEHDWGRVNTAEPSSGFRTTRVSADGRFAAFMSSRSLTGYDNHDAVSGAADAEVYLYDAETSKLVCVSCDPTGARPEGVEVEAAVEHDLPDLAAIQTPAHAYTRHSWVAGNIPADTPVSGVGRESLYSSRLLSDSGRLFFNSRDALASRDVNGQEDVYEFEPAGAGSCAAGGAGFHVVTGGCTSLISSGTAGGESGVLDASQGGADVFFLTGGQLVNRDTDSAIDVYDAHVCSAGSPCVVEQVAPSACVTADACRAAPVSQPSVFGAGPSETFSGAGDVADPAPAPAVVGRPKALSQAQRLALALKACQKKSNRRERRSCERSGRRKYAKPAKRGRGK
jgi:hypothetical protein